MDIKTFNLFVSKKCKCRTFSDRLTLVYQVFGHIIIKEKSVSIDMLRYLLLRRKLVVYQIFCLKCGIKIKKCDKCIGRTEIV